MTHPVSLHNAATYSDVGVVYNPEHTSTQAHSACNGAKLQQWKQSKRKACCTTRKSRLSDSEREERHLRMYDLLGVCAKSYANLLWSVMQSMETLRQCDSDSTEIQQKSQQLVKLSQIITQTGATNFESDSKVNQPSVTHLDSDCRMRVFVS